MKRNETNRKGAAALRVAGALLVLSIGAGCGVFRSPEGHMRRGDRFYANREFEKAAIEYLNVARAQPTNGVAMLRLGLSSFEAGIMKQAFPALLQARKCGVESEELALKLAVMYLWAGRHAQARSEIVTALDRYPPTLNTLLLLADASRATNELSDARIRLRAHEEEFGNQAAYHIALGTLDVRARDLKSAARAYEAAIETDPNSAEGHLHLAELYAIQGDTNRAEATYAHAAALAPSNSLVRLRWASFNVARGERREAQQILEQAVATAPGALQARFGLAEMAMQERRLDDAMAICDEILRRSPGDAQARLMRARILMAQGKHQESARECESILNAYPKAAEAMYLLALVNMRQQDLPKATALLTQAVAVNPDYAAAVTLLAELNLRSGRPELVIASLPPLIKKYPHLSRPYVLLGAAYRAGKRVEEEAALYRRMVEVFPRNPQYLYLLGASLEEAGRASEAAETFAAALELQPTFVEPLAKLAAQDIRLRKDNAGAVARVERQIQQAPADAGLYDLLGRVYLAVRDTDKAEAALKKSLELRPDSAGTLLALSQIYSGGGRLQEAMASLDRALAVNSNNVPAVTLSAMLLVQQEKFEEARARFERLLALAPKSVVAANNLAYLYAERLNNLERAHQLATRARELAPRDPYVADTAGWILCRRGEWKWALTALQESAGQLKDQPEVLWHLAACQATLGDEAGARTNLTLALQIREDFPQAKVARRLLTILKMDPATLDRDGLLALESQADEAIIRVPVLARIGRAHELADRRKPARDAYQKAIDLYAEHPGALLGLARLKALEGDAAGVLSLARKAHDAAPADPDTGLAAGRLALRYGDARWALGVLQETAGRLPDDPETQYALAMARFHTGQVRVAQELARSALQSTAAFESRQEAELFAAVLAMWNEPGADPAAVAQKAREARTTAGAEWLPAMALQARAQALQHDEAGEIETLEHILTAAPDFSPAVLRLADVYSGRPQDEERAYKLALRARDMLPGDPQAARVLGKMAYRRKDAQRASLLLAETLKAMPQDAEAAFYLGLARCQLGAKEEGKRLLQQAMAVRTDFPEIEVAKGILAAPPPK